MRLTIRAVLAASLAASICSQRGSAATLRERDAKAIVTQTVGPLMKRYGIPGMAIGLTLSGRHYMFDYVAHTLRVIDPSMPSTSSP